MTNNIMNMADLTCARGEECYSIFKNKSGYDEIHSFVGKLCGDCFIVEPFILSNQFLFKF